MRQRRSRVYFHPGCSDCRCLADGGADSGIHVPLLADADAKLVVSRFDGETVCEMCERRREADERADEVGRLLDGPEASP